MLTIEGLSAGYGKLTILHEVSLRAEPAQFVAILGPNGSGKSTLLKSIFGLTLVSQGAITACGRNTAGLPTEQVRTLGVAYVPQRDNVFTRMTVRENLRLAVRKLGRREAEQAIGEACTLFPILAERQKQTAGQLSGGERQMLAISMAWLAHPQVMLLDEPSAGLAPRFVSDVFRTLKELAARGISMVVVEQNARSVLRYCDYAYVLREGQVAFQGTAAQILADEETVKGYLGVGLRQV